MMPLAPDCPHHFVIVANPSPVSFCHAIAHAYVTEVEAHGQTATVRDLYAMAFNPVLADGERSGHGDRRHPWVDAELARLHASDAVVLVYPIWFGGPPAIMKGYVDRVLGAHCDFRHFSETGAQPALRGRYLFSISTSGTPAAWLAEHGQQRALREGFDIYLERGFGLRDAGHLCIDEVMENMSTAHARQALDRVRAAARDLSGRIEPLDSA